MKKKYQIHHPLLKREVWGLKFPNPVGLAAGFDKDAKLYEELGCFGFGFVEIGTLTPEAQAGNPRPRLFRLPKDRALINRMGFNNEGVEAAVSRLKKRKNNLIIGGNIGKNKVTPNEKATEDYLKCFKALYPHVDYFVVNVSSPNTPNLRELQEKEPLKKLLFSLKEEERSMQERKPILLKIAPDLSNQQLDDVVEIVKSTKLDGIIATNTTIFRRELKTESGKVEAMGNGGLSGMPLRKRSTEVVAYLHAQLGDSVPIIAVGGIFTPQDAMEKLNAGATFLQIYTSFIYEGPELIKKINKELIKKEMP